MMLLPQPLKNKCFLTYSEQGGLFKEQDVMSAVLWLKNELNAKKAIAFTQDSCGMRMMKQRSDLIKGFNELIGEAFEDVVKKE